MWRGSISPIPMGVNERSPHVARGARLRTWYPVRTPSIGLTSHATSVDTFNHPGLGQSSQAVPERVLTPAGLAARPRCRDIGACRGYSSCAGSAGWPESAPRCWRQIRSLFGNAPGWHPLSPLGLPLAEAPEPPSGARRRETHLGATGTRLRRPLRGPRSPDARER